MKPWENNRDCTQRGRGRSRKEDPNGGKGFHGNQTLGPRIEKKNKGVKKKLGTKKEKKKKLGTHEKLGEKQKVKKKEK